MLSAEFTPGQYEEARQRVKAYNWGIARAIQAMETWSQGYRDPQERRVMAQAVWHAAHESARSGTTASAAFHAFRPEVLQQLKTPQPRPASEIVILGAQHDDNLGEGAAVYDQPQTVRLRVLLEDYINTHGQTERRLAAYQLDDGGEPGQRLGYLPKDAPRRTGSYLATLQRLEGKKRIEGKLAPLQEHGGE